MPFHVDICLILSLCVCMRVCAACFSVGLPRDYTFLQLTHLLHGFLCKRFTLLTNVDWQNYQINCKFQSWNTLFLFTCSFPGSLSCGRTWLWGLYQCRTWLWGLYLLLIMIRAVSLRASRFWDRLVTEADWVMGLQTFPSLWREDLPEVSVSIHEWSCYYTVWNYRREVSGGAGDRSASCSVKRLPSWSWE